LPGLAHPGTLRPGPSPKWSLPILQRLKRAFRPFRPVLLPIWLRLLATVQIAYARVMKALMGTPPPGGIRPLTHPEFEEMAGSFPYYNGRWGYMSAALGQAAMLIQRHGLRTALELGAPVRPIIVGADVMDIKARPELDPEVPITIHDATKAPWPVGDKAYDLFLALQVFEHLRDRQPEAFREVRRVARHAIISLPIDWEMDDPRNCHHQIRNERVLSWFAPVVPTRVIQGNGGKRRRLIYVFENLPA
jgi:hypothetical protein